MAANKDTKTPIYLIAGFIESGKTSLIKNMLTDDGFSRGERTLIIACEEGLEELDKQTLRSSNAVLEQIEDKSALTISALLSFEAKYAPERVIVEYNGMWGVEELFKVKKPDNWELAQMVAMINARTFDNYINNMRQIVSDAPKLADLVIFNRCDESTPKSRFRRIIKAMNNTCNIIFENTDGTSDDGVGDEDLPYDVNAPVIDINDEQFGVWYIDCMEHPNRYDGKTVRVKGQAFDMDGLPKNCYVLGRYAMTCCAADIGGIGFVCNCEVNKPKKDAWINLTASVKRGFSQIHGRNCVILTQIKCAPAQAPKEELVYFNR